jgi:hypothetical protein
MTTDPAQATPDRDKTIRITIDGRPFTLEHREYTAAELLGLAGLPASGYDLTRVGEHGKVETFSGNEEVHVKDSDVFVSVNRQGTVA